MEAALLIIQERISFCEKYLHTAEFAKQNIKIGDNFPKAILNEQNFKQLITDWLNLKTAIHAKPETEAEKIKELLVPTFDHAIQACKDQISQAEEMITKIFTNKLQNLVKPSENGSPIIIEPITNKESLLNVYNNFIDSVKQQLDQLNLGLDQIIKKYSLVSYTFN